MLRVLWPTNVPSAPNMLLQVDPDVEEDAVCGGTKEGGALAMDLRRGVEVCGARSGTAAMEEFAEALQVPDNSLNYTFDDEFRRQLALSHRRPQTPLMPSEATAAAKARAAKGDAGAAETGDIEAQGRCILEPENEVTAPAVTGSRPTAVQAWDINSGARKDGLWQVTMVLPVVTHLAANVVGGMLASSCYAVGKLGEYAGAGKAVDSTVFQAGFFAWLRCNGIFPSVQYEPWQHEAHQLKTKFGLLGPLAEDDMKATPIIVSNHVSYLDGLVLAALFHAPRIVAKKGVKDVPALGKVMKELDAVFVDRGHHGSKKATLDALQQHCDQWRPGKKPLLIFPEGTTTNGESLLDFKKGAFISGGPVRPVLIVYTGSFDPSNTHLVRQKDSSLREMTDTEWAAQMLGHFVHSMHVRVLPPYLPSEAEQADADLMARNVRAHMAVELTRVRRELAEGSWKAAAGREHGGLDYQFGDLTKATWRKVCSTFGSE